MGHGEHFDNAALKLETPLLLEQQEAVIAAAEGVITTLEVTQEIKDAAASLVKTVLSAALSGKGLLLAGLQEYIMATKPNGTPKRDGSGRGVGANKNTGGCSRGGKGQGTGRGQGGGTGRNR